MYRLQVNDFSCIFDEFLRDTACDKGVGDLTKINVAAGDAGGELDPHGADGNG